MTQQKKIIVFLLAAVGLLVLPLVLQGFGNAWVRIADMALLYILLALGLNIVVGYAGLLDLGYVAFFAIGAYMYGLMASPHLSENFPMIAAMFPDGVHAPLWIVIPAARSSPVPAVSPASSPHPRVAGPRSAACHAPSNSS